MSKDTPHTGRSVRRIRHRRDMTQEELAEAAGLSPGAVKLIEQGKRNPRPATLAAIGRALGVSTTELLVPTAGTSVVTPDVEPDGLMAVRRALTPAIGLPPGPAGPGDAKAWQATLTYAERLYTLDKYDGVLDAIPVLIEQGRILHAAGDARPLAQAYLYTAQALTQLRRLDLANHALHKAAGLARELSDDLLETWAVSIQCWTMLLQRRFAEVEELAITTADRIEPKRSAAPSYRIATWGWLMCRASAAAVRDARTDDAEMYLRHAKAAATQLGNPEQFQASAGWAPPPVRGFCETTVGYKQVENAILIGDAGKGLELAERIPPSTVPTVNNRHRHELDLAAARVASGDHRGAIGQLLEVRAAAPEWLKHQSYARGVVGQLVEDQRRSYADQVGLLADHVGLPT
ncbi:helix-turn-helix transcriptional regulator [Kribbella qitaiheensis]|uniref:Helix-turn-helix transcriptional regulator n=1 Tax=Kribbella qitaiheensis TaxID=1544730 RepID=A0A7G6WW27_9ACTN|nr:helix-turn-helix transcriptional regulator [Kribbella qitaiheensis]QNE18192.1 helix-turn-helix transcriptional regulator [Kribbella qitaiheensis]